MRLLGSVVCIALFGTNARADPAVANQHYAEGSALYEAGQYEAAAGRFEQAFAADPDPAYLFNVGQAYRAAARCDRSADAYRRFLETTPDAPNATTVRDLLRQVTGCALAAEARTLLEQGKVADACGKLLAAHDEDPTAIPTTMQLGRCHHRLGKPAAARSWYRAALRGAIAIDARDAEREARSSLDALERDVATLTILVPPAAHPRVTIDGVTPTGLPRIELDPGPHVVVVDGRRHELVLAKGERRDLALAPTPGGDPLRRAKRLGLVGGSLVLGSIALSVVGRERYDQLRDADAKNRWRAIVRYGGTSMFVAGVAGLGVAAVSYVRRGHTRERPMLVPLASAEQVGFAISGAW